MRPFLSYSARCRYYLKPYCIFFKTMEINLILSCGQRSKSRIRAVCRYSVDSIFQNKIDLENNNFWDNAAAQC